MRYLISILLLSFIGFSSCDSPSTSVESNRPPQLIFGVPPAYPLAMKKIGKTGVVRFEYFVGADGSVYDVNILESPDPAFSAASEAALRKWKFRPGVRNGIPTKVRMASHFSFDLN
jgi:protein TonB